MKTIFLKITSSILLAFALLFGATIMPNTSSNLFLTPAYADEDEPAIEDPVTDEGTTESPSDTEESPEATESPDDSETSEDGEDGENSEEDSESGLEDVANACQEQTGSLAWLVCPGSGVIANATDALYGAITEMLEVAPLSMESSSPIFVIWEYTRNITNSLFAILLIIVIFSQITGIGLNNYGVKRTLPRLIIAVVLVNLSYIVCMVAVDASNIIGDGLRSVFEKVQTDIITSADMTTELADFSLSGLLSTVVSGGVIAGVTINALGGGGYIFFLLLTVIIGAIIAVVSGLATIAARQALVALLVMVSPLAILAYLLPNTESWFNKWKNLLARMLFFYPIFSFLFGASQLIGYALIIAANNPIGIILGIAVQIFPLFFSWSLMKMSGTILGTVNNAVRRIASPLQRSLSGWSLSMAEQKRQNYLAHSQGTGAKFRRYLDYRQKLRDLDTKNADEVRQGKATERAFKVASSSTGRDAKGNLSWSRYANRYTSNAKQASTYSLRAKTAEAAYKNTLSQYGDIFTDKEATRISDASGASYLEAMHQEFLTKNNAQADQEWLLNQYLNAQRGKYTNTKRYNELIGSAAGSLGHNGESSIIGQVISGNAAIEARRRSEARIIINKFGIPKKEFRAMSFDKAFINDDGFVTTADGIPIEDDQYRLKEGYQYEQWPDYIGVHKVTGNKLTKAEYDALSDSEREQYRRVRYLDIPDDNGDPIATVFEDDAGYMKEILTDDIYIGDPINRRYLTEMGVARHDGEKTGILRRYHSTIKGALETSGYKVHAAEVTPMITSQTNLGYVTSIGQYNIANLQSLNVASKAGMIMQNDSYAIDSWGKFITAAASDEIFKKYFPDIELRQDETAFAHYFPDIDILNYDNVNGVPLKGYLPVYDDSGNFKSWQEITPNDPRNNLDARKSFLRNNILTKSAKKLISTLDRQLTPGVLENQKDGTLKSLKKLLEALGEVGLRNVDPNTPLEETLGAGQNLFDSDDPRILKNRVNQLKADIDDVLNRRNGGNPPDNNTPSPNTPPNSPAGGGSTGSSHSNTSRSSSTSQNPLPNNPYTKPGVGTMTRRVERRNTARDQYRERNSYDQIMNNIEGFFNTPMPFNALVDSLYNYFETVECLQPLRGECQNIIENNSNIPYATSTMDAIHQIANQDELEDAARQDIHDEIIDLIQTQAQTF